MSIGAILLAAGEIGLCVSFALTIFYRITTKKEKNRIETYLRENY